MNEDKPASTGGQWPGWRGPGATRTALDGEVWPAEGMDPVEQDLKDFHVAK